MKTKMYLILLTCLVIGMIMPALAGSPDNNKGDKPKTENTTY